uniref:Putative secreted peptide n=1 Tax=Anopheles braziliensis TaxID=58242 RepID=A0A2M3ZW85_9DIPT
MFAQQWIVRQERTAFVCFACFTGVRCNSNSGGSSRFQQSAKHSEASPAAGGIGIVALTCYTSSRATPAAGD